MRQFDSHRSRPPRGRRDRDSFPFEEQAFVPPSSDRGGYRPASPGGRPDWHREGPAEGREAEATVKWFKSEKGFGFVELMDGSGDAFLHSSNLARVGLDSVTPGTVLQVRVAQGQKGPQVTEVISVSSSAPAPSPQRQNEGGYRSQGYGGQQGGFAPRRRPESGPSVSLEGTVKWYNATKGFGFVVPTDGSRDVFIHASTLARAGLSTLDNGQSVRLQVVEGNKGPEAVAVEAI